MNKDVIKLNYDKEFAKYNKELFLKLRDFGTKVLNLWVPDEDITLSILGILNSITSNGYNKVTLEVSKKTIAKHYDLLLNQSKNFSNISSESKRNYILIKFQRINIQDLNETISNYQKNQVKLKSKKKLNLVKIKKGSQKILENNIFDLPTKTNKDENLFLINKNQIKYYINDNDYFSYKINKIHYFVKLKSNNISSIKFHCENENKSKLVKFSKSILNIPLYEAYEHGVMKFENSMRKKNIGNQIKGIITPFVIKNFYNGLQKIMKNIFQNYKKKNQVEYIKNTFDQKLSSSWKNLSEREKIMQIKKIIYENSIKNNVKFKFIKIEDDTKILVDYEIEKKTNRYTSIYSSFLNLEKKIRKKLDKRLEIFYIYEKDANILRQK